MTASCREAEVDAIFRKNAAFWGVELINLSFVSAVWGFVLEGGRGSLGLLKRENP